MIEALIYVFVAGLGLFVGSFLNVCIYRIPNKCFFSNARSYCTTCGHTLSWYELFPVFSFLALRAKCKVCKSKISFRYPFVELLNMLLYILSFYYFGLSFFFAISCLMCSALIVVSGIDNDTKEIPNGANLLILILALLTFFPNMQDIIWYEKIIGIFVVSVPLWLITLLSKGGIGYGDIKLMAVAGLYLGYKATLLAGFVGIVLGGFGGLVLMLIKKKDGKYEMPLGPYLSAGILFSMFWGQQIVTKIVEMF